MKRGTNNTTNTDKAVRQTKMAQPSVTLSADVPIRVLPERASPFAVIAQSRLGIGHAEARQLATLLELTIRELAFSCR